MLLSLVPETYALRATAACTVRRVVPLTPLKDAVTVLVPVAWETAMPLASIVAVAVVPLAQVAAGSATVLPSVKFPVAVKSTVAPRPMAGFAGLIVIDCRVGAVTVRISIGLTIAPTVAVMFDVPTATPLARPVLEIVAFAIVAEFHVT